MILGPYRVGADIVVALDFPDGLPAGSFSAGIALTNGENSQSIGPTIAPLTVTTNSSPVGLTLTLAAAVSATLSPGFYAIDVKDTNGLAVSITDTPAVIRLYPAAV